MVSKKTGGLFRLLARLIGHSAGQAPSKLLMSNIEDLVSLIGIQYQIRDDYRNLYCEDYSETKGFCQDLDEGKFSFPIIHAFSAQPTGITKLLRELLQRRRDRGCLSYEQKTLVLKQLDYLGSKTYTHETLKRLEGEVSRGLERIEGITNIENWILRALLQRLEV
jgi:ophiobolin F synthase